MDINDIFESSVPSHIKAHREKIRGLQVQLSKATDDMYADLQKFADDEGIKVGVRVIFLRSNEKKEIVAIKHCPVGPSFKVVLAPINATGIASKQNHQRMEFEALVHILRQQKEKK